MKINRKEFTKFIDLVTLSGELENNEALIKFEDNKISTGVKLGAGIAFESEMKGIFEDLNDIGFGNLKFTKNAMKTLKSDDIEVNIDSSELNINDDKTTITIGLKNPDYVKTCLKKDSFNKCLKEFDGVDEFSLNKEQIKELVNFFKLVGSDDLDLLVDKNTVTVKMKNKDESGNKLSTSFDISESVNNKCKIKLPKFIIDLLNNFDFENLSFKIVNDKMMKIEISDTNINSTYIIAGKV